MHTFFKIFGEQGHLDTLQMSLRAVVIFLYTLGLIRISGRRSFGIRTPLDNIIVIILGAILSRAVAGSSPFVPIIVSCLIIVLMHRFFGWLIANNKVFGRLAEGNRILLFKDGHFIKGNIQKALICEEDIMQGVRKTALTEDLNEIDKIYIERNGEISAIKK